MGTISSNAYAQHKPQPLFSVPSTDQYPITYVNISQDHKTQHCLPHSYLCVDSRSKPSTTTWEVPRYLPVTWGSKYPVSRNQARPASNKEVVPPFICDPPKKTDLPNEVMTENLTMPQGRLLSARMRYHFDAGVLVPEPSSLQQQRLLNQVVKGRGIMNSPSQPEMDTLEANVPCSAHDRTQDNVLGFTILNKPFNTQNSQSIACLRDTLPEDATKKPPNFNELAKHTTLRPPPLNLQRHFAKRRKERLKLVIKGQSNSMDKVDKQFAFRRRSETSAKVTYRLRITKPEGGLQRDWISKVNKQENQYKNGTSAEYWPGNRKQNVDDAKMSLRRHRWWFTDSSKVDHSNLSMLLASVDTNSKVNGLNELLLNSE